MGQRPARGAIVLALAYRSRLDMIALGGTNDATSRVGSFMGGAHLCADDCRCGDVRDRLLHGRGSPGVLQKMNEACDHRSGSPRFMLPMRWSHNACPARSNRDSPSPK